MILINGNCIPIAPKISNATEIRRKESVGQEEHSGPEILKPQSLGLEAVRFVEINRNADTQVPVLTHQKLLGWAQQPVFNKTSR